MIRKFDAADFHQRFDTVTGLHMYYGRTPSENPEWCQYGPNLLDIELSAGKCRGNCKFCLTEDVKILKASGDRVCISDIKQGDVVVSFNEKTQKLENKKVIETYKREVEENILLLETDSGHKIKITKNHEVFVKGKGWVLASSVVLGDELIHEDL
jgi:hypothetical protein